MELYKSVYYLLLVRERDRDTEKFVFEAAEQCGCCVLLAFHALGTFTSQHGLGELFTTACHHKTIHVYNVTTVDFYVLLVLSCFSF